MGTLTAGTTYYILLDPETTTSVTQTFQINCPAAYNPCASVPTVLCGTPVTSSHTGTGVWSPGNCGFSTPGQEKVYAFTPTTTGAHNLQVTSATGGFVDYFSRMPRVAVVLLAGLFAGYLYPTTVSMGTLTAGTTYYILLDPEGTGAYSHTFQINCAPAGSAPPCVASPSSPTNGQTNICPSATQTLSWAASSGATSYDVYFGTTATPVFVATTAATSFVANTPTNGTYYWQIRPVGPAGTAAGCTVWSFTKTDVTLPNITCPANQVQVNTANLCSRVTTYATPTATDNCGILSVVLQSGLASGASFPVGVTTNIWRATDLSNNTRSCSFTITINDTQKPVITCPANIVKANDLGKCGAVTNYPLPTATDNCSISGITLVSGLASGSLFPVGTSTVTYKATDASNNTSTCNLPSR
ncbi:MAG: HYR domain-containing protein [Lewinellaceae bacterium]|nr:HYR domain-containing protein [Lewinellaceae bacterium]